MSVESFSGKRYFVTFIDEFSGYYYIAAINKKSEVLESFKRYQAWIERRFECKIKRLHCDGGGEYVAMKTYLLEAGIELEMSPPYSPNMNPIAERANRTLCESARSMLEHASLSRVFWAEAILHAAKLRKY